MISDNSTSALLGIIHQLFVELGTLDIVFGELQHHFPSTLYKFRQLLGLNTKEKFVRKVICSHPKCNKLYDIHETYDIVHGLKIPRKCNSPLYKRGKYAGKCGNELLTRCYSSTGTFIVSPKKTYVYQDMFQSF